MSLRSTGVLLGLLTLVSVYPGYVGGQSNDNSEEITRRVKTKVQPLYPELARKMNLAGTVKVEVTVAPNGTVKEAHVAGGAPVLAGAALEAAKKWRFEPAATENSGIIDFKFEPR